MFGMRCIEHLFDDILVEYCTSPLYSRYDDLLFQYGSNRRPSDIRPAISAYFERPPHVFFLFLRKVLSHPTLIILPKVMRMCPHQRREERRERRRSSPLTEPGILTNTSEHAIWIAHPPAGDTIAEVCSIKMRRF